MRNYVDLNAMILILSIETLAGNFFGFPCDAFTCCGNPSEGATIEAWMNYDQIAHISGVSGYSVQKIEEMSGSEV